MVASDGVSACLSRPRFRLEWGLAHSGWPTDVLLPDLGPLLGRGLNQVYVDNTRVDVVPGFLRCLVWGGLAQDVPFSVGVAFLVFVDDLGVEPSLGSEEMLKFFKLPAVRDPLAITCVGLLCWPGSHGMPRLLAPPFRNFKAWFWRFAS